MTKFNSLFWTSHNSNFMSIYSSLPNGSLSAALLLLVKQTAVKKAAYEGSF